MKKNVFIASLLILLAFSFSFNILNLNTEASTSIIISKTTPKDIQKLMENLKTHNITLDIENSPTDKDGKITQLKGKIDFGDGNTATFEGKNKIIIKKVHYTTKKNASVILVESR